MASIDYQGAKTEIEKIFATKDAGERKIIFWYDAPANFKEDILSDSFDCCKVVVVDKNEFALKKQIEHDEPDTDFLVYIPAERPADTDNWLLDILMYSEEYYADTVALTMRRLGLSNSDLRRVIERYAKFFDSETRIKKLSSYIDISDETSVSDFRLGMMATLVKASSRSVESILTELVFDTDAGKYKEIVKFGFEDYLWDEICNFYNYEGEMKIEILVKCFMFTAFIEQGADFNPMPSFYKQYLITNQGRMDAKFFAEKIRNDKRYSDFQFGIASELKIDGQLEAKDIGCSGVADIFECVDENIIRKISSALANGSLDYDTFENVIGDRINSIWFEKHSAEYGVLNSAIAFFKSVSGKIEKGLYAPDYVRRYTETYYQIDTYYRKASTNYRLIDNASPEMEMLIDRIELSYENFLSELGTEYTESLSKMERWEFPGIAMSKNFYKDIQVHNYKKAFVIISDGLRYEIGREVYEEMKKDPVLKGSAELGYAVSTLPSETRFGMAALLPCHELKYADKAVFCDGMPTNGTTARDTVLKAKNSSYAAITYDAINGFNRDELRKYMTDKTVVYIYHNVVDNTGEHNESKVFDVIPEAVKEIVALVRKLYTHLSISNFYVTADHGFIYRNNTVMESAKYSNIVSLKPTEVSKRYLITDDMSMSVPFAREFPLDEDYKIITPCSYDLFKTQGGGQQYIHGGTSLQETIVPVIHISELSSSRNKESTTPVGVRIKSINRKITNRSFTLEFEQVEKVEDKKIPITCETFLVDESGNHVSGEHRFIANSESDNPEERVTKIRFTLKNIDFDRNNKYFLILKDVENDDEYIEKEQFTVDILGFKMF